MVAAGINVEMKRKDGTSSVLAATKSGQKEVLFALHQAGADLNIADLNGITCLHIAVEKGDAQLVQTLIDANVDVNPLSNNRQTPLDIAQLEGFEEIIDMLLAVGATQGTEDEDDEEEDEEIENAQRALLRKFSVNTMLSRDRSPLIRVSGGDEIDGVYSAQEEHHEGKPLYVRLDQRFVIRWCEEAWIIDNEVRTDPFGTAVLMSDVPTPATETEQHWMRFEDDQWIEAPGLFVEPAMNQKSGILATHSEIFAYGGTILESSDEEEDETVNDENVSGAGGGAGVQNIEDLMNL